MNKFLQIVFYTIAVVLLPLGEIARVNVGNNVALVGMDLAVGIFSLLLILKLIIQRNFVLPRLSIPIGLFAASCILSLIVNIHILNLNELAVASLYLLRWISYAGIYFYVNSMDGKERKNITRALLASGFLIVITGYLQYFLYPNLRNLMYLGWDVHLYRMFGSFLDPNFTGAFLVLYLLFVLEHIYSINSSPKTGTSRIKKIIYPVLALATLAAIFLTYSRSAYLMVGVGLFVFLLLKPPPKKIILSGLIVIVLAGLAVWIRTKPSEGTNLLRVTSTNARTVTAQNALIIFQKNPVLGVGFDAYRYAQMRYKLIDERKNKVRFDNSAAGADNSWLFVLATTGIIGFASYLNLWVRAVGINDFRRVPLMTASSFALFVDSFFINSLFFPFIMFWMWSLIALI